jgi:regulator of replication initiation timing
MPRYAVNSDTVTVHDTYTLTERCNLDDMKPDRRQDVNHSELELLLREGFSLCGHCFGERRTP